VADPSLPRNLFPPAWVVATVGEVGHSILGQTKVPPYAPGQLSKYLRVANVQDGMLDLADLAEMPFEDPDRYTLHEGDILLCEGQSKELVGRAALYVGAREGLLFQNSLIRFRPYPGVVPEYALAVFRAYQKTGVFTSIAKSTTNIAHISLARFRTLPFPLPPTAIQAEIALNIGVIQDSLDLIAEAVRIGISELSGLYGIIRDDEILGTHAREWGNGSVGFSRWPMLSLKEVVPEDAPVVYGIVQPGPNVEKGVPYVRGLDLKDGHIEMAQLWRTTENIAERYKRSALSEGDVLLNIIRHTRSAIVPARLDGANITRTTIRVRPGDSITSNYLWHWLSSAAAQAWMKSRMRGIDMPGLNLRDIRELPIPVPPISVQDEISRNLDELITHLSDMAAAFDVLSTELPQLEASLLGSFSYGSSAASIAGKVPEDVQLLLGQELYGSLAEHAARIDEDEKSRRTSRARDSSSSTQEGDAEMQPERNGISAAAPNELMAALGALGGRASPEDLYAAMRLSENAVDSFYTSVRELITRRQLKELRPDNALVFLEIVK
jgi:type I restriction enzyme S subunit